MKQFKPVAAENCSELAALPCFRIAYYLGLDGVQLPQRGTKP